MSRRLSGLALTVAVFLGAMTASASAWADSVGGLTMGLATRTGGEPMAIGDRQTTFSRQDESLVVALFLTDGARSCWSTEPSIAVGGTTLSCAPIPERWSVGVSWFSAEPIAGDYDNSASCPADEGPPCRGEIAYLRDPLAGLEGSLSFDASDAVGLRGLGSHRIWAEAVLTLDDSRVSLATSLVGETPAEGDVWALPEVVFRRDDTYVGYVTELIGAPFVLGPVWIPGFGHQTDLRLAADCVALVTYGRRRLGEGYPYAAPSVLFDWAEVAWDGGVGPAEGVAVGDILHFGFQTAVLSVDLPPTGVLDDSDLIIHSFAGVAEEVPFSALPYRAGRFWVLRWP